jgi:hypothetical protein
MIGKHTVIRAVALTAFLFSLLVWFYVVIIQLTNPDWLDEPFSHLTFPPFNWRLDVIGMLAFGLAAIGFFVWEIERSIHERKS